MTYWRPLVVDPSGCKASRQSHDRTVKVKSSEYIGTSSSLTMLRWMFHRKAHISGVRENILAKKKEMLCEGGRSRQLYEPNDMLLVR